MATKGIYPLSDKLGVTAHGPPHGGIQLWTSLSHGYKHLQNLTPDEVIKLRNYIDHVLIEGQVVGMDTLDYTGRIYWLQVAGVLRDAIAKATGVNDE